ncbi:MAG: hypothetical protein V1838_05185 [Patescibacteria group bacterium]
MADQDLPRCLSLAGLLEPLMAISMYPDEMGDEHNPIHVAPAEKLDDKNIPIAFKAEKDGYTIAPLNHLKYRQNQLSGGLVFTGL